MELQVPEKDEFPFGLDFQLRILIRMCRDRAFLSSVCSDFEPKYFQNAYYQIIASCILVYFLQHKKIPEPVFVVEMLRRYMEKDPRLDVNEFNNLLLLIYQSPVEERDEFLEQETFSFMQARTFFRALDTAKKFGQEKNYLMALKEISRAANFQSARSVILLDHRSTARERLSRLATQNRRCVPTIFCPELDKALDGGAGAKELLVVLAPTGKGKTRFLVNYARGAMMKNLTVVYLSLEVSAEIICQRVDSTMTSMSRTEMRSDPDRALKGIEGHYGSFGGKLFVVEAPAGKYSVSSIEFLLDDLSVRQGINPDALIVDYADLLRSEEKGKEKRFELSSIYTDLREVGRSRDFAVLTASQSNRGSFNSDLVDLENMSEDIGKAQIADVVVSLCQNRQEGAKNPQEMRLYIAKNRNNPAGFWIPVMINPATMQIFPPTPQQLQSFGASSGEESSGGNGNGNGNWNKGGKEKRRFPSNPKSPEEVAKLLPS